MFSVSKIIMSRVCQSKCTQRRKNARKSSWVSRNEVDVNHAFSFSKATFSGRASRKREICANGWGIGFHKPHICNSRHLLKRSCPPQMEPLLVISIFSCCDDYMPCLGFLETNFEQSICPLENPSENFFLFSLSWRLC